MAGNEPCKDFVLIGFSSKSCQKMRLASSEDPDGKIEPKISKNYKTESKITSLFSFRFARWLGQCILQTGSKLHTLCYCDSLWCAHSTNRNGPFELRNSRKMIGTLNDALRWRWSWSMQASVHPAFLLPLHRPFPTYRTDSFSTVLDQMLPTGIWNALVG